GSNRSFVARVSEAHPGMPATKAAPPGFVPRPDPGCACCKGTGNIETCFAIRFAAGESLFLARAKRRFPAPNGCLEITKKNAQPEPLAVRLRRPMPVLAATAGRDPCLAPPGHMGSTAPPLLRWQVRCNGRNDSNSNTAGQECLEKKKGEAFASPSRVHLPPTLSSSGIHCVRQSGLPAARGRRSCSPSAPCPDVSPACAGRS